MTGEYYIHLKDICWKVFGWTDLVQDREKWWVPVNTVVKLLVP
jgi:hypothetical protein